MVIKALHGTWPHLAAPGHIVHCRGQRTAIMALNVVIALHNLVKYGHRTVSGGHTWSKVVTPGHIVHC